MLKLMSLLGAASVVLLSPPVFAQAGPQMMAANTALGISPPGPNSAVGMEAQASTPQAFLEAVFKPYLESGYRGQHYWEADRFFEPALANAIKADREAAEQGGKKPRLNIDPFVSPTELPRDWQISNLTVAAVATAGGAATGQVLFVNQKKPSHQTINLVKTADGWRIAEIRGSGSSLRVLYGLN